MQSSKQVWNLVHRRSVVTPTIQWFSTVPTKKPIILYQYEICPFCNICKAYLKYSKQSYQAIEVNPLTKEEIKWAKEYDYKKVPIATIGNETTNDDEQQEQKHYFGSDDIVQGLISSLPLSENNSPSANDKWTSYAKEELAPLLYPNLCNTLSNSFHAFDYVHQINSFSTMQKYSIQSIGSLAMYFAASKIKKKRGIDDEKLALKEALVELESALEGNKFLNNSTSQDTPDLGDLYVYGVLRGLEGLAIHKEVMTEYTLIPNWYETMKEIVEKK